MTTTDKNNGNDDERQKTMVLTTTYKNNGNYDDIRKQW